VASKTDVINVSEPGAGGLTKDERVGGMGEGMKKGGGWRVDGGWRMESGRKGALIEIGGYWQHTENAKVWH
jgi:hypothetical protein